MLYPLHFLTIDGVHKGYIKVTTCRTSPSSLFPGPVDHVQRITDPHKLYQKPFSSLGEITSSLSYNVRLLPRHPACPPEMSVFLLQGGLNSTTRVRWWCMTSLCKGRAMFNLQAPLCLSWQCPIPGMTALPALPQGVWDHNSSHVVLRGGSRKRGRGKDLQCSPHIMGNGLNPLANS